MSFKYEQRRELLGIGTSSGSGRKRAAEDRGHSSIYDIQDESSWKREKPTPIQTASTAAQESNPFDNKRVRANADSLSRTSASNPTARRIVTEHSSQGPSKRPRMEMEGFNGLGDKYPEKYGGSDERQRNPPSRELGPRAIPSLVQKRSTADPPLTGQVKANFYLGSRAKQASTLTSQRKAASTSSIINIDGSDPDDDKDKGAVEPRPKPLTHASSQDEIDIIEHTSGEASQRSISGASGWFNKPHSEREKFHESDLFRQTQKSSPSLGSATRPKRPRYLPSDGTSTKQLVDRLRSHKYWDYSYEVEEIEDADAFVKMPKTSSSKNSATENLPRGGQSHSSGASFVPKRRVSGIVNQKISVKHQPRHYADLKQAGNKLGAMKGKTPPSSSSKRMTGVTSRIGATSRDKLATASTPYIQNLALPLELFVWGCQKEQLDGPEPEPDFWLYWNEGASELQVYEHAVPQPETLKKRKPMWSIPLSSLEYADVQVSDDPDLHVLRIDFTCDRDSPDDVRTEGLTFKILSRHGNITEWDTLMTRIKNLLLRYGRKPEILKGSNAKGCLQSALQSADIAAHRKRRESTKITGTSNGVSSRTEKPSTHEETKKRPQPRPVINKDTGKNGDISQMLIGLPRRSNRLSSGASKGNAKEATKDRKETGGEPPSNLDEIILVYPPSGQGAVNITIGDLRRLEPSEFLNDTIIEFGLKLWLNDLRQDHPELADCIHVFSPFFFKKLVSKSNKTPEDGHKSVRKWTAKVDIFKKKYIIVPINENIHWYLAIIYHPEHILEPAPPKPRPRTSKRLSDAVQTNQLRETTGLDTDAILVNGSTSRRDKDGGEVMASTPGTKESESEAEAEVEGLVDESRSLRDGNQQQSDRTSGDDSPMSIDRPDSGDVTMDMAVVDDSLSEESDDEQVDQLDEDSNDEQVDQLDEDDTPSQFRSDGRDCAILLPSAMDVPMSSENVSDGDIILMDADNQSLEGSLGYPVSESNTEHPIEDVDLTMYDIDTTAGIVTEGQPGKHEPESAVPPTNFYGRPSGSLRTYEFRKRPSTNGSLSVRDDQQDEPDELDMLGRGEQERQISEEPAVSKIPCTIIFTMDSLGNQHPKALTRLNQYLQEEAKDKKGVTDPSNALTKKALVPTQPNYCDCGLYLLHFAQTFVSDPEKYKAAIFSPKRTSQSDRNTLWLNEQVGTMREQMKDRILLEAEKWKMQKAAQEQKELENGRPSNVSTANQPAQTDESDDEIEVSEVRHVGSSTKKQTRAARLR